MPIYEYACRDCGKEFELLIATEKRANEQTCPHCASPQLDRKFSAFASFSGKGKSTSSPSKSCSKFT